MMTTTQPKHSSQEFDTLLQDWGDSSDPQKEASVEELLQEIFALTEIPLPTANPASLPTLPKEESRRSFISMRWIAAALLIGLLIGSSLGFAWAEKGVLNRSIVEPQQKISVELTYWIDELKKLYDAQEKKVEGELIEPVPSSREPQSIAPSEIT